MQRDARVLGVHRGDVRVGHDLAQRLAETLMRVDRQVLVEEEHDEMLVHEVTNRPRDTFIERREIETAHLGAERTTDEPDLHTAHVSRLPATRPRTLPSPPRSRRRYSWPPGGQGLTSTTRARQPIDYLPRHRASRPTRLRFMYVTPRTTQLSRVHHDDLS